MRLCSSGTVVHCLGFLLISFGVSQAASLSDSLFSSNSFLPQQDSSYKATQSENLKLIEGEIPAGQSGRGHEQSCTRPAGIILDLNIDPNINHFCVRGLKIGSPF